MVEECASRRLAVPQALEITRQIAGALEAADQVLQPIDSGGLWLGGAHDGTFRSLRYRARARLTRFAMSTFIFASDDSSMYIMWPDS